MKHCIPLVNCSFSWTAGRRHRNGRNHISVQQICWCTRTGVALLRQPPRTHQYRELIGEATGADSHRMRLTAAAPPPNDAALNGVLCRTVIAVSHPPHTERTGVWHSILVDCRPLHEGWLELALNHGILDANELVTVLNDSAPLGWFASIDVETDHTGCLYLPPGSVFMPPMRQASKPSLVNPRHQQIMLLPVSSPLPL